MEAMFVVCLTFQRFQTVLCLTFQVVSGLRPKALLEEDIQFTEGKKSYVKFELEQDQFTL